MPKITPFLWFDGNAGEAAKFYTSIFKKSNLGDFIFGKDPVKAQRAMQAMLKMAKLDIQKLKDAYAGR